MINRSVLSTKAFVSLFLWCLFPSLNAIIADGRGVFRVAISVYDRASFKPIQGVELSMADAGAEELKSNPELAHLVSMLAPKVTNEFGDAFVYYYGGFSSSGGGADGKYSYERQVRGKLKIQKVGYEVVEIDLKKFIGPSFDSSKAIPFIEIHLQTIGK